ncbi:calmodulin [Aplysia californica]|uniref:Calmodulin n=1 Tax=Aplysia californica TaxID=6500 RepID=A0ABM1ABK1_APLCA|nr:calmodulin [Aplysia californica]
MVGMSDGVGVCLSYVRVIPIFLCSNESRGTLKLIYHYFHKVLDKTGSGRITVSDFRHFMTTMGERMTVEEAEELIARSTQDGKDYIEYRDLVQAVQHLPT